MIYEFLIDRLGPVMDQQVYPSGVCIDDIPSPFAVYTYKDRTAIRDLGGELHHYQESVTLDFLGELYDQLHELARQAEDLLTVSNYDTGHGEYIFSASCASPEPDSFDPDTGLHRRTVQLNMDWCPA